MKLTLEEKLRNVKLHLEENVPINEIQKSYRQNSALGAIERCYY